MCSFGRQYDLSCILTPEKGFLPPSPGHGHQGSAGQKRRIPGEEERLQTASTKDSPNSIQNKPTGTFENWNMISLF